MHQQHQLLYLPANGSQCHDVLLHATGYQRELVVGALIAACVFESSDRARALLFRVIEKYRRTPYRKEFDHQYAEFKTSVDSMVKYAFTRDEFDPKNPKVRLEAIRKVLEYDDTAVGKE